MQIILPDHNVDEENQRQSRFYLRLIFYCCFVGDASASVLLKNNDTPGFQQKSETLN